MNLIAICFSWNICVDFQILQRSFEIVEAVNFLNVETLILQFRLYIGHLILKHYYFFN